MAYPATEDATKTVLPAQDANQGELPTGRVRSVLGISLGLAVAAGVVLFAIYFL